MKHILLIDDDPSILLLFSQFLEGNSFTVTTASDGREALRILKEQTPDLIITDIMMPEMDGLGLLMELQKEPSEIPVIAISGGMKIRPVNFLPIAGKLGAKRIFEKPIALTDLLQAVRELLDDPAKE